MSLSLFRQLLRQQYQRRFILPLEGNYETSIVGKLGIAKSCDVLPSYLESDNTRIHPRDYKNINDFDYVFVTTSALPEWFRLVYPRLVVESKRIFLVTGDSVVSAPLAVLSQVSSLNWVDVVEGDTILHWFAQNCDLPDHRKVTPIPLGVDFHTLNRAKAWGEPRTGYREQDAQLRGLSDGQRMRTSWLGKNNSVLVDFHHSLSPNPSDRLAAYQASKRLSKVRYLPFRLSRTEYWKEMRNCKYVLSPLGAGLDCHRTWEAIVLGTVPIIRRSTISSLFTGLPVLEVESYDDLSDTMLDDYRYPIALSDEAEAKLKLDYWIRNIRGIYDQIN